MTTKLGQLQPGYLIFFEPGAGHTGLYLGDIPGYTGPQMLDAPETGQDVTVQNFDGDVQALGFDGGGPANG